MRTPHEYQQFLRRHFPGLVLQKPVFYNGEYGLRFSLQVGPSKTDEYFRHVIERATALFEAAFAPDDRVLLLVRDYKHRRRKIRFGNYLHQQIRDLTKTELACTTTRGLYRADAAWNQEFLRLPAHRIAHRRVLTAIAQADFPSRFSAWPNRRTWDAPEVYFLNLDRGLVFHMYDDRGLDIIASTPQVLRPLYEQFNDWLLDYDRATMDQMMR